MDQIIIKDILARGIIGINDTERVNPQDILINLIISTDITKAGETDDIECCVNYKTVIKKVLDLAETANRLTVEALASDIASLVLAIPLVKGVRVRVEKPGAVRFAGSVGVEIERWKT
ncbi:MAG: dihydroneopterin aldolase [Anaerolinea sp.]|nr:dihydroneopterin aldolase [Anaerolinea sp.]